MARPALEYPLAFRVFRRLFPVLQSLAPNVALNIAVRLFLTPIRFKPTKSQALAEKTFKVASVQCAGREIKVYEKGSGPSVLMLHGWSGRAMQFAALAESMADSGYRVVLIDAPGHGKSAGGKTNLFEFAEAFETVFQSCDDVKAVIGHSLGAASISYAISAGLSVPAFVTLGAPVIAKDILDEFGRRINAHPSIQKGIREKSIAYFGKTFEEVTMEQTFRKVTCPVLGVHGLEDLDVPSVHLEVLQSIREDMEAHFMPGMGHRRILKDEEVIKLIVRWIDGL